MSFRVTGMMIFSNLMSNMRRGSQALGVLQEQMATLRRINRASDDPAGASRAQSLLSNEHDYKQYGDNIDQARSVLDFTAGVLETISAQVVSVRGKILSAINPTSDASTKEMIASEVDDMLKSILAGANSSFAGMYVFGGTQTDSPPFELASESVLGVEEVAFCGNSGTISYVVGPTDVAEINENPREIFMPRGEVKGLFNTLIEIRRLLQNPDNLTEGELSAELSETIARVDVVHDDISRALGRVGTRSKALSLRRDLYEQAEISSTARRSDLEDADIADVAMRLQNQQTIFEVIMASGSFVFNSNLADFLR